MITLSRLTNFFRTLPEDREIIDNEVRKSNFTRAFYITTFCIGLNLIYITCFAIDLNKGSAIEVEWRRGIIITHACIMILNVVFSSIAFYLKRNQKELSATATFLTYAVMLMLAFFGIITATIDQWVTASIIAFSITIIITAVAILMPPVTAFYYFTFSYILFCIGVSITQSDPALLLTNQMNGFSAALAGFGMAIVFWQNNLIRYRQSRLIEKQKIELQLNNESLKALNATKDKFFSIISHDLRGPLSGTLSLTELMNSKAVSDDPGEQKQMMQMLQENLNSAFKLLENLLYWSGTQTGSIAFKPEKFDIKSLIDVNIELFRITAANKGISVLNNTSDAVMVYADKEMLSTVLRNLLSNAIKFSYDLGLIEISCKITGGPHNKFVEVSIRDNGTGVDPVLLNDLFEIGSKVSLPGTKNETGTGLGLILCKEFIEKHGGSIRAESIPGKGSTFIFTLPGF